MFGKLKSDNVRCEMCGLEDTENAVNCFDDNGWLISWNQQFYNTLCPYCNKKFDLNEHIKRKDEGINIILDTYKIQNPHDPRYFTVCNRITSLYKLLLDNSIMPTFFSSMIYDMLAYDIAMYDKDIILKQLHYHYPVLKAIKDDMFYTYFISDMWKK